MGCDSVLLPLLSQGEAGDDAGPIVALPPHEDLSPESSAASDDDLEAGDLDARRTGASAAAMFVSVTRLLLLKRICRLVTWMQGAQVQQL
jgi:hypothetical protein